MIGSKRCERANNIAVLWQSRWWPIEEKPGNLHYGGQPGHQCATHPSFHPRSKERNTSNQHFEREKKTFFQFKTWDEKSESENCRFQSVEENWRECRTWMIGGWNLEQRTGEREEKVKGSRERSGVRKVDVGEGFWFWKKGNQEIRLRERRHRTGPMNELFA